MDFQIIFLQKIKKNKINFSISKKQVVFKQYDLKRIASKILDTRFVESNFHL